VHLFCQDREAGALGWVDRVGQWGREGLELVEGSGPGSPGTGTITAYTPEIGGLLPVYVEDRYAGFRVKAYPALSDSELSAYIEANVDAVREVDDLIGGAEAALANHLILGPLILARAGLRFAAKVHGSALSYTVKPHARFLPEAREGLSAAEAVLVGSRHTAESLWETIRDSEVERKTRLGPPGVDVEAFAPLPGGVDPGGTLEMLARELDSEPVVGSGDSFDRDPAEAAAALRAYAGSRGPRVAFVGKLIVSKGCDLLLAAWPLVRDEVPDASLLVVGFGAYRAPLEQLWSAISGGDLAAARRIAELGWALEGGAEAPLRVLSGFLADPPGGWLDAAAGAGESVSFAGRLDHAEVADVLAASDAMVVPSTFPEAFGMVAAEAAATGALPVCADHSGLAEVARELDRELPAAARGLTGFPLCSDAVSEIADRLLRWMRLPAGERERERAERALIDTVRRLWSWEGVAQGVLEASAGELDRLPPVPAQ
jgi:glycosyltransferase involved in cell wall biosynthesis